MDHNTGKQQPFEYDPTPDEIPNDIQLNIPGTEHPTPAEELIDLNTTSEDELVNKEEDDDDTVNFVQGEDEEYSAEEIEEDEREEF